MAVDRNSQFLLSRELGKGMVARRAGKIIFTVSLLTFQGGIPVPGYVASKSLARRHLDGRESGSRAERESPLVRNRPRRSRVVLDWGSNVPMSSPCGLRKLSSARDELAQY